MIAGNYGLQQEFLDSEQRRISARLFERGVTSRIIAVGKSAVGATVDLTGFNQLDKLFVPSLGTVRDKDREERELSLVAITTDPSKHSRAFTRTPLGRIDNTGTLYSYPGIPPEDAEIVHDAAKELLQAKADGLLPNLSNTLMDINNPNTGLTSQRPPEAK